MESGETAAVFAALGQASRLDLLRTLLVAGPEGLSAGALSVRLGIVPSTLSFHLKGLEQVGLIRATRHGRHLIYSAQVKRLRHLMTFLSQDCCSAQPELSGSWDIATPAGPTEDGPISPTFNVLFLCTRNSARSLIAEAILNKLDGDRFRAYSAGMDPIPQPMPEAIEKLRSLGHDVSAARSKSYREFQKPDAPRMNFVIGLSAELQGQHRPSFSEHAVTASWPLPGPGQFPLGSVERTLMLRELYASLFRRISIFTSLKVDSLDRMSLRHRLDELSDAPLTFGREH